MGVPDVSVVIVNYATTAMTTSLARQVSDIPRVGEVIVVDNSGTAEQVRSRLAEDLKVRVIDAGFNRGFGGGCNAGAAVATGDILAFLNSDLTIDERSLNAVADVIADPSVGVAAPQVVDATGRRRPDSSGRLPTPAVLLARRLHTLEAKGPDWVTGAAMFLRAETFDEIGGFDERFHMYFEDVDLCRRVAASGRSIVVVEDAVAHHSGGASHSTDRSRQRRYAAGLRTYLRVTGTPAPIAAAAAGASWGSFVTRAVARRTRRLLGDARRGALERIHQRRLRNRPEPRVNLGCGNHQVDGWINVDVTLNDAVRPDVVADLSQLPFRDGSLSSVYCGHVLEHLSLEDAASAVAAVHAALATTGSLLAVGPDVDRARRLAEAGALSHEEYHMAAYGAGRWPTDVHLWQCTEDQLVEVCRAGGFVRIKPVDPATITGWPITSRAPWQCGVIAHP